MTIYTDNNRTVIYYSGRFLNVRGDRYAMTGLTYRYNDTILIHPQTLREYVVTLDAEELTNILEIV